MITKDLLLSSLHAVLAEKGFVCFTEPESFFHGFIPVDGLHVYLSADVIPCFTIEMRLPFKIDRAQTLEMINSMNVEHNSYAVSVLDNYMVKVFCKMNYCFHEINDSCKMKSIMEFIINEMIYCCSDWLSTFSNKE